MGERPNSYMEFKKNIKTKKSAYQLEENKESMSNPKLLKQSPGGNRKKQSDEIDGRSLLDSDDSDDDI